MKLIIDIPKEFEEHFNEDRFKDSFERIKADLSGEFLFAGTYERELLDALVMIFEKAEVIHSTCVLEGKPIYNDVPAQEVK